MRALLAIAVLLSSTPAPARTAITPPPCHNQWIIQSLPEMTVAYNFAVDATRYAIDRSRPPQVMPTGDALHPFLVATYGCSDLWLAPAGLEWKISADEEEAKKAWAQWSRDVARRRARKAGIHSFGSGEFMAWVIR